MRNAEYPRKMMLVEQFLLRVASIRHTYLKAIVVPPLIEYIIYLGYIFLRFSRDASIRCAGLVALSVVHTLGVSLSAFDVIANFYYPMLLLVNSRVFVFLIPEKKTK